MAGHAGTRRSEMLRAEPGKSLKHTLKKYAKPVSPRQNYPLLRMVTFVPTLGGELGQTLRSAKYRI